MTMRPKHITHREWLPSERSLMADLYPHIPAADVAALLGRPVQAVYQAAARYGLYKTPEFLASDMAARIQRGKQNPAMIASRFVKGLVPWNKGIAFNSGGRSHEHRFKPGSVPHTTLPVGTLRITNHYSQLERKVSTASGANNKRWKAVHRLVWEAVNGPTPAGHICVFKPGCKTTVLAEITIDKVECISRATNAMRNHPRHKHPELGRLVQLKGAITRQVNRLVKDRQDHQTNHPTQPTQPQGATA